MYESIEYTYNHRIIEPFYVLTTITCGNSILFQHMIRQPYLYFSNAKCKCEYTERGMKMG